jgi:uncharacterized protein (DUF885 family)
VKKIIVLLALAIAPALIAAQGPERFVGPSSQTLYALFVDYWEWRLAQQPELATRFGRVDHNDRWRDWSKPARDRARTGSRRVPAEGDLPRAGQSESADRLSARLMISELQTQLEAEPYLNLCLAHVAVRRRAQRCVRRSRSDAVRAR